VKKEFLDYIEDILDAMVKAETFVQDLDYEHFVADAKTTFAVTRALEIIGEAVKKVPRSVRTRYADVPWKDMAGMRDKLTHEYWGVNLKTVWKTVKEDIPSLKPLFEGILQASVKKDSTS
jgi:uncharacterized protein with HEPN domain